MKILDPNGLIDNLYKYVQTNIEIAKLEFQEKLEESIKKVVLMAILAIMAALFLTFLLITIALFLNEILESQYLGFLLVTVLIGILCGVVFMQIQPLLKQHKANQKLEES